MNKSFTWKFSLVIGLLLLSLFCYSQYGINKGLDIQGGWSFLLRMDTTKIDPAGRVAALRQAIEIIRKRVDKLGISEPILQAVGTDRILVQLPGLEEKRRD